MEDFPHIIALQFYCVVGLRDGPWVEIERIGLHIVEIQQQEDKGVKGILRVFLTPWPSLILSDCIDHHQFADIVISLDIPHQVMLSRVNIVTELDHLAAIDIVEVDEEGTLEDRHHEIASK
jgi:hypothetical protein